MIGTAPEVFAPCEHHMLEQVCETCFSEFLILRRDVVPDIDGHDRGFVILVHEQGESVLKHKFLVRNIDSSNHRGAYFLCVQHEWKT